ncbi:NAD-dependent epimerase/dehydratase family protein [Pseudalkalibacillus sp. SCS-8]|uniref:NAD-dependent epimerase/dehydratase family protein n=1 Tax=Pseudalkalibacillus nanhaiensis TaxID=3115291 RepID=UPI0032DAC338
MAKVLVTGGCGFIGSHIVEKLVERKFEIVVVDNLTTGKLSNIDLSLVDYYNCDINSRDFDKVVAKTMPQFIIHQAAQVSVPKSIKDIIYDTEVNIGGSIRVIEAAKNYGVKKIIFASTAAVYGEPQYLPVDTRHPVDPLSPYGLSKYTVENYLKLAKSCYGLDYTILRYSNVYGPRQNAKGEGGVVAIFSGLLSQNQEVLIHGDGMQTRDFVYVEDVANANLKALEKGSSSILNVATSTQITINDLFNTVKKYSNATVVPNFSDVRDGDIKHSVLCNKLTRDTLDWEVEYNIEEGINKTVNQYNGTVVV